MVDAVGVGTASAVAGFESVVEVDSESLQPVMHSSEMHVSPMRNAMMKALPVGLEPGPGSWNGIDAILGGRSHFLRQPGR